MYGPLDVCLHLCLFVRSCVCLFASFFLSVQAIEVVQICVISVPVLLMDLDLSLSPFRLRFIVVYQCIFVIIYVPVYLIRPDEWAHVSRIVVSQAKG